MVKFVIGDRVRVNNDSSEVGMITDLKEINFSNTFSFLKNYVLLKVESDHVAHGWVNSWYVVKA